jgi:hypothetical protein
VRRLRLPIPLVLVCALAWLVAMVLPLTAGAFWPIAVAPEVLRHHATTFAHDPISVLPLRGTSWVVQPWAVSLLFDGAWKLGGVAMLSVLQGVLSVAAAALAWRVARMDASPTAAGWAALAFVALSQPTTLRAEQVALVLALVLMLVLRSSRWWLAPLIIVAWVNVHGSFVIGLALIVASVLGMVRGRTAPPLARVSLAARCALVVVSVVAVLASPLGIEIVDYVRSVDSVDHIEALTPIWNGMNPLGLQAGLVYVVLAIVLVSRSKRPRAWRAALPLIPVVILLVATFGAVRYASWLAVALLPELAIALERIASSGRVHLSAWTRRMSAGILGGALLVAIFVLIPGTSRQDKLARLGIPSPRILSEVDRTDVVFASPEWADYVRIRTGARIVLDARLERYRSSDLANYLDVRDHAALTSLERPQIDHVLLHWSTLDDDAWPDDPPKTVDGYTRTARDGHGAAYEPD